MVNKRSVLLCFAILFLSCGVVAQKIDSEKFLKEDLLEVKRGYYPNGFWGYTHFKLIDRIQNVVVYMNQKKSVLYKNDELGYIKDLAMANLLMHKYIDSFLLFNDYIKISDDRLTPLVQLVYATGIAYSFKDYSELIVIEVLKNKGSISTDNKKAINDMFQVMFALINHIDKKEALIYCSEEDYKKYYFKQRDLSDKEIVADLESDTRQYEYNSISIEVLKRIENLNFSNRLYTSLFYLYLQKKSYQDALRICEKLFLTETDLVIISCLNIYYLELLFRNEKYQQAVDYYRNNKSNQHLAEWDSRLVGGAYWVAYSYLMLGQYNEAFAHLQIALNTALILDYDEDIDYSTRMKANSILLYWWVINEGFYDKCKELNLDAKLILILKEDLKQKLKK